MLPLLLAGLCVGSCVNMRIGADPPPGYRLVFSDEFDRDGLADPARWNYAVRANRSGWHNRELQYYSAGRSENARVEHGKLIIEARHERLSADAFPDYGGQEFTSARLNTRGRASWLHAFVEVRARIPCAIGTWPAIWMLPADETVGWPAGGEIDIMEHVGFDPGRIHQTVQDADHTHVAASHWKAVTTVRDACDTFHLYQLWWEPGRIRLGIDGTRTLSVSRPASSAGERWPFDDGPFVLILNLAVGGDWGGAHGVDQTALPARMEVDFVRIYQKVR